MKRVVNIFLCALVVNIFLCSTGSASAAVFADSLKGWTNFKENLADKGLEFEVVYTGEYWANTKGGLKHDDTYLSNLDITFLVDTQKAGLWDNGQLFIYVLGNSGREKLTGELVGDLQTISNIEAPRTTRLFELWYEHFFLDERLSTLVGLHDYNSEFAATEYGSLFINSSFGIGAEMAIGARPSIFPLAALGGRLKYMPDEQWEVKLGIYDGNPGDPEISEHLPRSVFASDQGVFIGLEVGYSYELGSAAKLPGTVKVGYWHNTGEFDDILDTDAAGTSLVRDGNQGGYLVVDQLVYREAHSTPTTEEEAQQGLGIFLQFGGTPDYINEVDYYLGGGFHYTGLIPTRDADQIGFAVGYASISNDLVDAGGRKDAETVLELTYRAEICDNFVLQPNLQYVLNPGAVPTVDDAFVAGLRFEIAL